jgi:RNA polymerase sigma factor (sigma-70 family)
LTTVSEERDLLKRLAENDPSAAEKIYKDNYGLIQALVINNNGSVEDARDIFQETMVALYERVRQGNLELNCQLKTFLYAIGRRLWLKKLQQSKRYSGELEAMKVAVEKETADRAEDWQAHEERDQAFGIMENALGGLGEPCRSLLTAFYIQKRSMAEISESFGYTTADNAKTQKYKCLQRLKKLFFAQYKKQ